MIKYSEIARVKVGDCFWEVIQADDWMLRKREATSIGKKQIETRPIAWKKLDGTKTSKASGERKIHREWCFKDADGNPGDRFEPPLYETEHEALTAAADRLHAQALQYDSIARRDFKDAMHLHTAASNFSIFKETP